MIFGEAQIWRRRWVAVIVALAAMAATVSEVGAQSVADIGPSMLLIDADFPDPAIVRTGDQWYAFATNGIGGNIQVRRSADLHTWTTRPDAMPHLPAWAEGGQTWAPAVVQTGSSWTLFFAARHESTGFHCIGRATAPSIDGPFRDAGSQPFLCQMDRRGSIDPSVFRAADGTIYLLYKSEGIEGREPTRLWSHRLSADAGAPIGEPVELAVTDHPWEEPIIEGPVMVEAGGSHWLLYAASLWESSQYAIGVARCDGPQGPCMKWGGGPLVASNSEFSGPGAPDVVTGARGETLLTFHAWDPGRVGYRQDGRRKARALSLRVEAGRLLVGAAPTPTSDGYRLVAKDGGIFSFGRATFEGSTGNLFLNHPIVDMAATVSGRGYWLTASDGGIFAFGDAGFFGSEGGTRLNRPIVGMAASPSGKGYWLVASDGGVFTHGDAMFLGSTGARRLNSPIVGMAATPSGRGYWLVASDGGIFAFGDARFHGSTGALVLNSPIVEIVPRPWATGYWLVASDGGVFAFGDAAFHGSTGNLRINAPVVAAAATPTGDGYWFTGSDGGVFAFGDAAFRGSTGGITLNAPMVGISG